MPAVAGTALRTVSGGERRAHQALNAMDEGAYIGLKALHRELDEAVAGCYGWPRSVAKDDAELVARLTDLNRQISAGEREYRPFAHLDERHR